MQSQEADIQALIDANQRFYDAFGALDIDQMAALWETSDRAMCVHPGWPPLVTWELIRESWRRIFENTALMNFNIRQVNVAIEGDCGWVTCFEGITSVVDTRADNFSVLVTNIFVRTPQGWRMVSHQASPAAA